MLAERCEQPEVVDGVIQGAASAWSWIATERPPTWSRGRRDGRRRVEPVAPRFEDAFVDLLGGGPKGDVAARGRPCAVDAGARTSAVVEARELTKRFGDFTAADHITFRIGRGEIFGLLGPNGAGKSTTFKMMCGLLRPTAGTARVAGFDLYRAGGIGAAQLGYMAQKFSLYGDLSVRQNLDFFAGVYGLARRDRRRRHAAA